MSFEIPRTEWTDDSVAIQDGVDDMAIANGVTVILCVYDLRLTARTSLKQLRNTQVQIVQFYSFVCKTVRKSFDHTINTNVRRLKFIEHLSLRILRFLLPFLCCD